jgi:hypothetical protein
MKSVLSSSGTGMGRDWQLAVGLDVGVLEDHRLSAARRDPYYVVGCIDRMFDRRPPADNVRPVGGSQPGLSVLEKATGSL